MKSFIGMSSNCGDQLLVYNDFFQQQLIARDEDDESSDDQQFYAEIFFELANVHKIGYRLKNYVVWVDQDPKANDTTGGIVWESGYLLSAYLVHMYTNWIQDSPEKRSKRMNAIDLGAGTGMLGLVLSRLGLFDVTVTEYYDDMDDMASKSCHAAPVGVFDLLERNVFRHNLMQSTPTKKKDPLAQSSSNDSEVKVRRLDWTKGLQDIASWEESAPTTMQYDLVVGTDVVFTPSLVRPLLITAAALTKPSGRCVICIQLRCTVSNELFISLMSEYFDSALNISESVYDTPGCEWGRHMECFVYEMKGPVKQTECGKSGSIKKKEKRGRRWNSSRSSNGGGRTDDVFQTKRARK
jgi:hypothetical protein